MPLSTDPDRPFRSKIQASLFDTAALSAPERYAAWRESVDVFLDTRPPRAGLTAAFNARLESYLLDDIVLARSTISAQKFDRGPLRIAKDSIDHYMIQLFMAGSMEMNLGSRSFRLESGGLIAFDLAEVMDTFDNDCDVLCAVIPRRRLAPLLTKPDSLQGARVDPTSGAGLLLASYFVSLFNVAPQLTSPEASTAARSLVELVSLAFNGARFRPDDIPDLAQQAELLRVQNFIRSKLPVFELGPDMVAAALGMSRARLYRLFAPVGGVAEYIREQRLRRSLADLLSNHKHHRRIADIAYSWGFTDPASFSKAFKQRFGQAPSDACQAAQAESTKQRTPDPRLGDRLYEQWLASLA